MRVGKIIVISMLGLGLGAASLPAYAAETITYAYDALRRLVQVVHSGTVNNGQTTVYTHDPADNRTNVTTTGASH